MAMLGRGRLLKHSTHQLCQKNQINYVVIWFLCIYRIRKLEDTSTDLGQLPKQEPAAADWQQILGAMRIGGEARSQLMGVRRACLERLGEIYRKRGSVLQELKTILPAPQASSNEPDQTPEASGDLSLLDR